MRRKENRVIHAIYQDATALALKSTKQKMKEAMRSMSMPNGVSKRWFGEVSKSVKPMTEVRVDHHWNVTEVCTVKSDELVAAFRSGRHAVEFCKLNSLQVKTGIAC